MKIYYWHEHNMDMKKWIRSFINQGSYLFTNLIIKKFESRELRDWRVAYIKKIKKNSYKNIHIQSLKKIILWKKNVEDWTYDTVCSSTKPLNLMNSGWTSSHTSSNRLTIVRQLDNWLIKRHPMKAIHQRISGGGVEAWEGDLLFFCAENVERTLLLNVGYIVYTTRNHNFLSIR